jgi:hypoxanthine phosphoribosyltransferase
VIKISDKYFEDYISEEEIKKTVTRIASEINADHTDFSELIIIGVLNGSIPFMNDVVFKLPESITIDYVKVSSYGNNIKSSGNVELLLDTKLDTKGKDKKVKSDYSGIEIADDFIIGYGLDYAQKGRNINRVLKLVK